MRTKGQQTRRYGLAGMLASLLALCPVPSTAADVLPKQPDRKEAAAKRTIFDCVDALERRGGGWCELQGASIADVFPKNLDPGVRMVTGPRSVIDAWNGAAFDPERLILYFHGGGHRDYGGNEVYSFDLREGVWRRLTDPAPLPAATGETPCPVPAASPSSSHTYDGIIFSVATRTIWLFPSIYACLSGMIYGGQDVWEFNPDTVEARNGLAPLTWRKRSPMPADKQGIYFRTAAYSDGRIYVGAAYGEYVFDPRNDTWKRIGAKSNLGPGPSVYDSRRKLVWTSYLHGLYVTGNRQIARKITPPAPGIGGGSGLAIDDEGTLTLWNGGSLILRFDPDSKEWRLFDWKAEAPPYTNRPIYSRWVYVPALKVYVGYADFQRGIWIYRHPADRKGEPVNTWPIQGLLDAARPGGVVTVPPGIYPAGATIGRSMTLRLKGARIIGRTGRKGVLLVKDATGPVVIEDFETSDPVRCGNCAGIKIEGADFDVTVRRARIARAEMGILTDNRGGRLVVEDTLIEDIGHERGAEPMHLIYAGIIDELIVRRSTLRRSHHFGHLLKSRARSTDVRATYLLGLGSLNSREADLSCGGKILFDNVVIQKGPKSDNQDSIAVATEPKNCAPHAGTSFTLKRSWLIFDRPDAVIGSWGVKQPVPFHIAGNRFVGPLNWGEFVPADESNRFFDSRAGAGLGPRQIPEIEGVPLR